MGQATVCPHCKKENVPGGSTCEHWICAQHEDIVKLLVSAHVSPSIDAQKLEQYRRRYMNEIGQFAIESGEGWFTRTADAERMRRRLQQTVVVKNMAFKVVA